MTSALRTIEDLDVARRRVVVRADLNVPMDGDRPRDASRIAAAVPTLIELANKGASVAVISHLGRPAGVDPLLSLAMLRGPLEANVNRPVRFVGTNWVDRTPQQARSEAVPGEIVLMENTRFHPGEEANDPTFARTLAELGDIFVNDAFSVSHRAHASTEGIARLLPSYAGRTMQAELSALDRAFRDPARPVGAVVGGAKISTKLRLLENIVKRVDFLFVGGAMANTFLHAQGFKIGKSLCEPGMRDASLSIIEAARASGCSLVLPRDAVSGFQLSPDVPTKVVDVSAIPADAMILDIGPKTVAEMVRSLARLRTLLWNGPLGAFEVEPFGNGTFALAEAVARLTGDRGLISIAGGGDTVAALNACSAAKGFSFVSTAGGAFLELLEGRVLPGVEILRHQQHERRL